MRNGSIAGNDVELPSLMGRRNLSVQSEPRVLGEFADLVVFSVQHETDRSPDITMVFDWNSGLNSF